MSTETRKVVAEQIANELSLFWPRTSFVFASLFLCASYLPGEDGNFAGHHGYGYKSIESFVQAAIDLNEGKVTLDELDVRLPTIKATVMTTAILEAGRMRYGQPATDVCALTYAHPPTRTCLRAPTYAHLPTHTHLRARCTYIWAYSKWLWYATFGVWGG